MYSKGTPRTRLFVNHPLTTGAVVPLLAAQVHHLRTVLRKSADDAIRLFNGRDGEWLGRLTELGRSTGTAVPEQRLRPQDTGPDIWLCAAPIKRARMDWLVEKATELGASAILPVITARTDVAQVRADRLADHALGAAQQCERLDVPQVLAPLDLSALLDTWPAGRALVAAAEQPGGGGAAVPPLAEVARRHPGGPAALLIGPEGGFTVSELDALVELPFARLASLGPRILRAETAALAALACWQCLAGDWSEPPPDRGPLADSCRGPVQRSTQGESRPPIGSRRR